MTTSILERTDAPPVYETERTDDPGHATHIVLRANAEESSQAYILRAMVEGFEVEALCGYRWIPSKDPKDYPICSKCKDIYEGHGHDDRDRLPDA